MIQDVLGLPVEMAEPYDFRFLSRYGTPFCAFDKQDSGNICFGMAGAYGRLFVKFAGAQTARAKVAPGQAIAALRQSAPVYEALRHPALVRLRGHGAVAGGYAAVFDWADGEGLHPYWKFDRQQKYTDPDSPSVKLRRQPLLVKLKMLDRVFDFHAFAAQKDFVPVDFYDGSLMANFDTGEITICDIDLYRRMPTLNDRGRMPGSSRFLSPEEYRLGAPLDERTAVYVLGALAHEFLGDNVARDPAAWTAAPALLEVARRALNDNPEARYPCVNAFLCAWRAAVGASTVY